MPRSKQPAWFKGDCGCTTAKNCKHWPSRRKAQIEKQAERIWKAMHGDATGIGGTSREGYIARIIRVLEEG